MPNMLSIWRTVVDHLCFSMVSDFLIVSCVPAAGETVQGQCCMQLWKCCPLAAQRLQPAEEAVHVKWVMM